MRELSLNEVNMVGGGLKWRGRRQSDNVIDTRSGFAYTTRAFGVPFPDMKAHYETTGTLLTQKIEKDRFQHIWKRD